MGYYMAGDYYMAGGIFGSIGKVLGGVAKTAIGAVGGALTGGPLGAISGALGASGILKAPTAQMPVLVKSQVPIMGIPGLPPTSTGLPPGTTVNAAGQLVRKRRRMNPANPKALRRAMRREEAFVKMARRALKGSKYTVSTRGSSRSRRDVIVPRHTQVR